MKQKPRTRWNSTIRWTPSKMKRSPIKRGVGRTKLRRIKEYAKYLRSSHWKALRLEAFAFYRGLCRCPVCVKLINQGNEDAARIDVWFRKGKPFGFDCHHVRYPSDLMQTTLADILIMKPEHHQAVEARTGKRRHYLNKGAAA